MTTRKHFKLLLQYIPTPSPQSIFKVYVFDPKTEDWEFSSTVDIARLRQMLGPLDARQLEEWGRAVLEVEYTLTSKVKKEGMQ